MYGHLYNVHVIETLDGVNVAFVLKWNGYDFGLNNIVGIGLWLEVDNIVGSESWGMMGVGFIVICVEK